MDLDLVNLDHPTETRALHLAPHPRKPVTTRSTTEGMLVAVTDHAAERFRQRVRGTLDAKTEIAARVARARAAGQVEHDSRGRVLVRDVERRDLVYVGRLEGSELVVVTLWEEGDEAAVPKRFTDALRRDDHRVADGSRPE